MTSSRLPGKILYPLTSGTPVLVALITRLKKIRIEWWLATTDNKEDDITATYGKALGIKVFRGSEKDVLSRFEQNRNLRFLCILTHFWPAVPTRPNLVFWGISCEGCLLGK